MMMWFMVNGGARCSRIHAFKLQILDSWRLHGGLELKVIKPNVPGVVLCPYQQEIGAYSGSILNLPERDCLGIRRASFIRSAKISFRVESDFTPVDVPFRARLGCTVPIEWNGISTRANGNKSIGSPPLFPTFYFFPPFEKENMSRESTAQPCARAARSKLNLPCAR